jgi:hypothetical protein
MDLTGNWIWCVLSYPVARFRNIKNIANIITKSMNWMATEWPAYQQTMCEHDIDFGVSRVFHTVADGEKPAGENIGQRIPATEIECIREEQRSNEQEDQGFLA